MKILIFSACLCISFFSGAYEDKVSVEALGKSEIRFGDQISAREFALRDAIVNASLQVNAQVNSSQVLENGNLTVDYLRINSAAKIHKLEVLDEYRQGDEYIVEIVAQVSKNQTCATHVANDFRKSVAVTGFALQDPLQTSIGHLGTVDRDLASYLVNGLNDLAGVRAIDANHLTMYPNIENAPAQLTRDQTMTKAVDTAQNLGVQYIVSGVIRDLSMDNPNAPYPKKKEWFFTKKNSNLEPRTRRFVFDLFVHDGYSGALIMQSRYAAKGAWNEKHHAKVGFGSGKFFSTDYGKSAQASLSQAVKDLQSAVQCQPYVASIKRVDDKRIYVEAGANSGLRPGDSINVYRTSEYFDRDQSSFWQLTDTKLVAIVKQVQPHFAIAELPIAATRMNIQMDDVIFAW